MQKFIPSLLACLLAGIVFAQPMDLGFQVLPAYQKKHPGKYFILTLDSLDQATTLADLHPQYPADWIAEYYGVKIVATGPEGTRSAAGRDATLTPTQLALLGQMDDLHDLTVSIDYLPKNNLQDNPPREMTFTLVVEPFREARFPGGQRALVEHLRANTIGQLPGLETNDVEIAALHFTVNEEGLVSHAELTAASGHAELDTLLLAAVCSLPRWQPARDAAGQPIPQSFDLGMGQLMSMGCYRFQ